MIRTSYVFSQHLHTSPYWLTEVLTILQCSLKSPYTNSQIYSYAEYLSDGLPVSASIRPFLHISLRTGLRTRSGPTDPVLGLLSWSGRCWACLSTLTLCAPVPHFLPPFPTWLVRDFCSLCSAPPFVCLVVEDDQHISPTVAVPYHGGLIYRVHSSIGCSEGSHMGAPIVSRFLGDKMTRPSSSDHLLRFSKRNTPHSKSILWRKDDIDWGTVYHIRELVIEKKLEVQNIGTDCLKQADPDNIRSGQLAKSS